MQTKNEESEISSEIEKVLEDKVLNEVIEKRDYSQYRKDCGEVGYDPAIDFYNRVINRMNELKEQNMKMGNVLFGPGYPPARSPLDYNLSTETVVTEESIQEGIEKLYKLLDNEKEADLIGRGLKVSPMQNDNLQQLDKKDSEKYPYGNVRELDFNKEDNSKDST